MSKAKKGTPAPVPVSTINGAKHECDYCEHEIADMMKASGVPVRLVSVSLVSVETTTPAVTLRICFVCAHIPLRVLAQAAQLDQELKERWQIDPLYDEAEQLITRSVHARAMRDYFEDADVADDPYLPPDVAEALADDEARAFAAKRYEDTIDLLSDLGF